MDILKEFIKNIDTGWIIKVSGKIFSETTKHKSRKSKAAVPYLNYINSIVENAVLLDSNIIPKTEAKSENSIMMHSMYAVADIGNRKEVLKLFVEELNDVNSDGTIKRSYKLIMPTASARVQGKSFSSVTNTVDNIKNISDLFNFVKTYDKDFKPVPCSVVVNEDGAPKEVYHVSIFYDLIGDKNRDIYFPKSFDGETIFEIDNKLIYADTDYHYHSISKVITINNLDIPEQKQCIEVIINGEELGIKSTEYYSIVEIMYGEGTISSTDFVDSKAYRREKDSRRKRDGSRTLDSRSEKDVLKSKPDTDAEIKPETVVETETTSTEVSKASISVPPVLNIDPAILLKRLGTAANVYKIERTIAEVQRDLIKKHGKKAPKLKIPDAMFEAEDWVFLNRHYVRALTSYTSIPLKRLAGKNPF